MEPIKNIKIDINIDDEIEMLCFKLIDEDKKVFTTDSGLSIQAITKNELYCYDATRIDENNLYIKYTDTIIELFIDEYNEIANRINENLQDGVEPTIENANPDILSPYDPNSIKVSQGRFSLREIYEMIVGDELDEPILDLSPDFQRGFVWDSTRKSRLIESILLKIPLPVFYLARDMEGKYQVVDGVQRFSVIKDFFSNGFKLRNLEYLKEECDNKYFQKTNAESLHPRFIRGLRSYQIDCNIIEPETPHKVKLDIFKRLNTGGRSLNDQEIRNSILRKESRDFIRKLAKSKEFTTATCDGIKPKRMMDQEVVIRYIGFYFIYKTNFNLPNITYTGIMKDFLDNIVEILNNDYDKISFEMLEKDFYKAMRNAYIMFGDYAFRKIEKNYKDNNKSMINKSLFTSFSILLSNYDYNLVQNKGNVLKEFSEKLKEDDYLYDSITYGSNDKARIDTTFLKIEEFLESLYGGEK